MIAFSIAPLAFNNNLIAAVGYFNSKMKIYDVNTGYKTYEVTFNTTDKYFNVYNLG